VRKFQTTAFFAALIPLSTDHYLYGLFTRATVLRYRPFTRLGRSVLSAANPMAAIGRRSCEALSLVGRAVERRAFARRLAVRRIGPFVIFDVAQVSSDRGLIA
jgi:hypothetical protein